MARNENSANNVRFSYSVLTIEVPNVKSQIWDLYCKHCLLHICFNVVDIFTRNAFLAALYLLIILWAQFHTYEVIKKLEGVY